MSNFNMKTIFFVILAILTYCLIVTSVPATTAPSFQTVVALKKVFRAEGTTWSTDRRDSGNWSSGKVGKGTFLGSKFGISGAVYGMYFSKQGKSIKEITIVDASRVYDRDYVKPLHLEAIRSQWLGTMFLDTAINCGVPTAAILINRTVNVLKGLPENSPSDPTLDMEDISWINNYTQTHWYQVGTPDRTNRALFGSVFKEMRTRRYVAIVDHDPNKLRYLPVWIKRTYE